MRYVQHESPPQKSHRGFSSSPVARLSASKPGRALDLGKIVILVGPRRAGKTFYLFQLMDVLERSGVARQQMLYINFEDERLDLEGGNDLIIDALLVQSP